MIFLCHADLEAIKRTLNYPEGQIKVVTYCGTSETPNPEEIEWGIKIIDLKKLEEEETQRIRTIKLILEEHNPINSGVTVEQALAAEQEKRRKQREQSQKHRFNNKKHNYFG